MMTTLGCLKSVLVEQMKGYNLLLGLLQRERSSLLSLDALQVEELSKEKDTVIMRLSLLENERVRLTKKYSQEQGIADEICLSGIAEASADEEFHALRLRLAAMLQSVCELNEYNRILAERSLSFAKNAIGLLSSLGVGDESERGAQLISKEA
ncbi:MAG: flagellar protein FlgN [Chloroflexota bacterium]